ncbi:MAG: hypothetical protein ACOC5F_06480 [Candidatus Aminicenantaceae bacterium]
MSKKKSFYPNREAIIRYMEYSEENAILNLLEKYMKLYPESKKEDLKSFIFWLYRHKGVRFCYFSIHEDKDSDMGATKLK